MVLLLALVLVFSAAISFRGSRVGSAAIAIAVAIARGRRSTVATVATVATAIATLFFSLRGIGTRPTATKLRGGAWSSSAKVFVVAEVAKAAES